MILVLRVQSSRLITLPTGDYNHTSYNWTVSRVQSCDLANEFHFMVASAGDAHGVNSPAFRVVATESDLPTATQLPNSTQMATATKTSAAISTNSIMASSSPMTPSKDSRLATGLSVGLSTGLALSFVVLGILWYRRKQKAHRSMKDGPTDDAKHLYGSHLNQHQQSGASPQQLPADRTINFELDAVFPKVQQCCELEGSR